jgi:uncharacterized protein YkwD
MLVLLAGALAAWLLAAVFFLSVCRAAARGDAHRRSARLVRVGSRGATTSLAVAAVTLPLATDEAGAACANRDLPYEANPAVVREAMLCEMSAVRERRDARRLRVSAQLDIAASGHAADMFQRKFFSHVSPGGGDLADRARRAGFVRDGCSWAVGEILAWGVGSRSTAAGTVRAWLRSPSHRRVLLSRRYGRLGLGLQLGTPYEEFPGGVTVAAVLGRRHC